MTREKNVQRLWEWMKGGNLKEINKTGVYKMMEWLNDRSGSSDKMLWNCYFA